MSKDETEFALAVEQNEYAEYTMVDKPTVALITDMDSDPYFLAPRYFEDHTVDDLLTVHDWFTFQSVEFDPHNSKQMGIGVWHIHGFELTE